jgi:hypothetical protein
MRAALAGRRRPSRLNWNHGDDAGLGQRGLVVHRSDLGTEPWGVEHDCGQHPGGADVDREASRPEDLRHGVDAQPSFAPNQSVVGQALGLDTVRNRQLLGARGKLGERRLLAARVTHDASLELDLVGGHIPELCRRGREPRPGLRCHHAVANPESLRRVGAPGELERPPGVGIPVDILRRPTSVCGVDHDDRIEIGVKLLGHDRRQPGVDPLAHLDLARVRDDRPVLADPDVRMDRVRHLIWRQPMHLGVRGSDERARIIARGDRVGGVVDRGSDPGIGAAAAQVPAHPLVDLRVAGGRV